MYVLIINTHGVYKFFTDTGLGLVKLMLKSLFVLYLMHNNHLHYNQTNIVDKAGDSASSVELFLKDDGPTILFH